MIKIKTKTKAFLDEMLSNPKISNTEAYIRTHQTTNRRSASVSAAKLLAKPSVQTYLQENAIYAKRKIFQLMNEANKEEVQLRAAQDILDRAYGASTKQSTKNTSGVKLVIDLASRI